MLLLIRPFSFMLPIAFSREFIYGRFAKKRTTEKVVALTFDDGPDPIQTPKVLEVLKEYRQLPVFSVSDTR